jgi:hypothetical protein
MPGGGIIKTASPNLEGRICSLCEQIAFRIAVVEMGGAETEVPFCGRHYIETLRSRPAVKQVNPVVH